MNYLPFNPSFMHSLPVAAAAIALFCSCGKKIVKAISEFVICVFQEAGRAVLECRKVVQEVRRGFTDVSFRIPFAEVFRMYSAMQSEACLITSDQTDSACQ